MNKKLTTILMVAIFSCIGISANDGIDKQTFVYSIKGVDTLRLDKYDLEIKNEARPCIIFMFGGGFVSGNRDSKQYTDYFKYLVKNGFSVVSIDYRLGLKNIENATQIDPVQFAALLNNSIYLAVEDLFDATTYVVNHSKIWNIKSDMIVANGSSSGAIAVLHGEYAICNYDKLTEKLPKDFNYAGVISFAGAIFSTNGDLKWQSTPSPIQLFHGDADSNVPYNKVEVFNFGFYGSHHIANQLNSFGSPYYFYKVIDAAHEISNSPMSTNRNEINSFLSKFVLEKQPLIINTEVKKIGTPEMKKDFELMDYITSNFKM